jgi:hypothetical protein
MSISFLGFSWRKILYGFLRRNARDIPSQCRIYSDCCPRSRPKWKSNIPALSPRTAICGGKSCTSRVHLYTKSVMILETSAEELAHLVPDTFRIQPLIGQSLWRIQNLLAGSRKMSSQTSSFSYPICIEVSQHSVDRTILTLYGHLSRWFFFLYRYRRCLAFHALHIQNVQSQGEWTNIKLLAYILIKMEICFLNELKWWLSWR